MSALPIPSEDVLWKRALAERESQREAGLRVLVTMLAKAGYFTTTTVVGLWPRADQGEAYLWAQAFLQGRENIPPPECVTRL